MPNDDEYDFNGNDDGYRQNFGRDINEEDASIPMSNLNIHDEQTKLNNFSKRPQTSHGRGR